MNLTVTKIVMAIKNRKFRWLEMLQLQEEFCSRILQEVCQVTQPKAKRLFQLLQQVLENQLSRN